MSLAANRHRSGRPPRRSDAACRAVTSAERFPAEPPETKTPPASPGNPARPATHRSASFSAQIAPAPSIHPAAIVEDAPTMRSKSTLAFVGAAGTNATDAGWSVEIVAGARTSAQIRSASSHADPVGSDRAPGAPGELVGRCDPIQRLGACDPVPRVRDDRPRELLGLVVVRVHAVHHRSIQLRYPVSA